LFSLFLKKLVSLFATFSLFPSFPKPRSVSTYALSYYYLLYLAPPLSSYSLIIQPHPLYYSISNSYSVKPVLSSQITVLGNRDLFPYNLTGET
jgi:hypothetical protein